MEKLLTRINTPPNSMFVQIPPVQLKVQPIHTKRLHQPQHRLPEKPIQPELRTALIQYPQHARPKHKRHELAGPLDPVLDVGAGDEGKGARRPARVRRGARREPCSGTGDLHNEDGAEDVEGEGKPDGDLLEGVGYVNRGDPEGSWDNGDDRVPEHGSAHGGDFPGIEQQRESVEEARRQVERYQRRVCMLPRIEDIRCEAE